MRSEGSSCKDLWASKRSEVGSRAVQRVVDLVHNIGSTDNTEVECPAVESLQGLLATADGVELDKDLAVGIGVDGDVNDFAVLLIALDFDLDLKLLGPVGAVLGQLPAQVLAQLFKKSGRSHLLISLEDVLDLDAL